jgi:hypothetical protein
MATTVGREREGGSVSGAISRFEQFFRLAADLHVDKSDLRRFEEFMDRKLADVLLSGEITAKANGRDVIESHDLVITKGLQERVHDYRRLDADVEIRDMLARRAVAPQMGVGLSTDARDRLPEIAGGLALALARVLRLVDTRHHHPGSDDWLHAEEIFNLLV